MTEEEKPQTFAEAMERISQQAEEYLEELRPQKFIESDKYDTSALQALRALKHYGEEIPHARRDLENRGILRSAAYFTYACAVIEASKTPESAKEASQMVKKFAKRISF